MIYIIGITESGQLNEGEKTKSSYNKGDRWKYSMATRINLLTTVLFNIFIKDFGIRIGAYHWNLIMTNTGMYHQYKEGAEYERERVAWPQVFKEYKCTHSPVLHWKFYFGASRNLRWTQNDQVGKGTVVKKKKGKH